MESASSEQGEECAIAPVFTGAHCQNDGFMGLGFDHNSKTVESKIDSKMPSILFFVLIFLLVGIIFGLFLHIRQLTKRITEKNQHLRKYRQLLSEDSRKERALP
ncbi:Oidioi.mRNA.OKI2018_I69.chr1.g1298.t1.cds [Oikopleura dioica]|uniref:Oidioi.mRNA.OKI2018_I69.chr1.g1298.t1.cds n=1 Tax=Oikopleura dioica TaxID=34765 RepID=A0ABN7SSP8_OIKDI|nr:Oidioi.mRNA.OKI2018_I69.chr1.g1298.t1.cds [Oikopleura dioica]